jgi:hypothetical protein
MEDHAPKGKNKEHWMELCAQAAVEQDPARLMVLIKQITGILEEKEQLLLRERSKGL